MGNCCTHRHRQADTHTQVEKEKEVRGGCRDEDEGGRGEERMQESFRERQLTGVFMHDCRC